MMLKLKKKKPLQSITDKISINDKLLKWNNITENDKWLKEETANRNINSSQCILHKKCNYKTILWPTMKLSIVVFKHIYTILELGYFWINFHKRFTLISQNV